MGQAAPLNIKKCSIHCNGNFAVFFRENFDTLAKCMFGRDNSITGEDLAQEAMLYLWQNYWKGQDEVKLEPKGFYSASNLTAWTRMKCRQLISNTTVVKENRSKYQMVQTDHATRESGLTPEDSEYVAKSSGVMSHEESKNVLEYIRTTLEENFPDDVQLAHMLFFVLMGYTTKEVWDVFGVTKASFYKRFGEFEQQLFEEIKEHIKKEFSE